MCILAAAPHFLGAGPQPPDHRLTEEDAAGCRRCRGTQNPVSKVSELRGARGALWHPPELLAGVCEALAGPTALSAADGLAPHPRVPRAAEMGRRDGPPSRVPALVAEALAVSRGQPGPVPAAER